LYWRGGDTVDVTCYSESPVDSTLNSGTLYFPLTCSIAGDNDDLGVRIDGDMFLVQTAVVVTPFRRDESVGPDMLRDRYTRFKRDCCQRCGCVPECDFRQCRLCAWWSSGLQSLGGASSFISGRRASPPSAARRLLSLGLRTAGRRRINSKVGHWAGSERAGPGIRPTGPVVCIDQLHVLFTSVLLEAVDAVFN
jgi:hypothetical protein